MIIKCWRTVTSVFLSHGEVKSRLTCKSIVFAAKGQACVATSRVKPSGGLQLQDRNFRRGHDGEGPTKQTRWAPIQTSRSNFSILSEPTSNPSYFIRFFRLLKRVRPPTTQHYSFISHKHDIFYTVVVVTKIAHT